MSFIEKVCEFSGEFPEENMVMRDIKHNHIQILPKYRKMFKGVKATLHFYKADLCLKESDGLVYNADLSCIVKEKENIDEKNGFYYVDKSKGFKCAYETFFDSFSSYKRFLRKNGFKLIQEYRFVLEVEEDSLKGEVNGLYENWTFDRKSTIRKIKKMVGKGLKVKVHK